MLHRVVLLVALVVSTLTAIMLNPSQNSFMHPRDLRANASAWQNIDPPGVSDNPDSPANNYGFNSIVVDPATPSTIYLGTNYQGLYKSTNRGASWTKVNTGAGAALLDSGRLWTLAIDPFQPQTLYTTAGYGNDGVLKSTDGGISWTDVFSGSAAAQSIGTNDVYSIAVDPFTPNHLLAAFHYYWHGDQDSGVVESSDGGVSWTVHAPVSGWGAGNAVWFLNNSRSWLVASQSGGAWRTTNSGASWTRVAAQPLTHGGTGALVRGGGGTFYLALSTQILRSTNNGASWSVIGDNSTGLPYADYETVAFDGANLYTAPSFPDAGDNGQARGPWYVLRQGATSWEPYSDQMPCDPAGYCNGPVMTARDAAGGYVYAVNWNGGAWRLAADAGTPTPTPTASASPAPTPSPAPSPTATPASGTFGNTTVGGTLDQGDAGYMNGSRFVTGSRSGSVSSMSVYVAAPVSSPPNNQYQLAIYTDNDGEPGTLVAHSASETLLANAWNTASVTASLQANTAYWLMYQTNASSANANNVPYSSGTGAFSSYTVQFGTWPSTFGAASICNCMLSIYATYAAQ